MKFKLVSALFLSLFLTTFQAKASLEFQDGLSIEAEYAYRQKIENEAASWAKDLMYLYREAHEGPNAKDRSARRMGAELAWLMIFGHGALATFDFKHSELAWIGQIPAGSTSRLVSSLKRSKNFWIEVRNQCLELKADMKAQPSTNFLRECKEQLQTDLSTSQIIGSNVSLFVGGGVIVSVGTKLYRRFASQWISTRVLPLIPAFARSKYVAFGLTGAIIILPTSFIVAGISEEQKTQQLFLENLETSLTANAAESEKESVLRQKSLKQEREVLEFALWIGQRLPKDINETEAEKFLFSLRLTAPYFQTLKSDVQSLEERRLQIEHELQAIPDVAAKLQAIADARKVLKSTGAGQLTSEDAALFRKAQHLAALRLALRAVNADLQSSPSVD